MSRNNSTVPDIDRAMFHFAFFIFNLFTFVQIRSPAATSFDILNVSCSRAQSSLCRHVDMSHVCSTGDALK